MPQHRVPSVRRLGPRRVSPVRGLRTGAVVVALALSGCGLRLEGPPPPLPSPDAAETARQGAAERAVAIAGLADASAVGVDDPVSAALARVSADSSAHADALGGVWAPPAWASPDPEADDGADDGAPDPGPSAVAEPSAVLDALTASAALTCADAVVVEPADLATLLASICLAQDDQAEALAGALGADAPPSAVAATTSPEPAEPPAQAVADVPGALELARALDAAGYALEVAAARSAGPDRATMVDRAALHRTTAQAIIAGSGALGTADDPRRAAYDLGSAQAPDGSAAVAGDVAAEAAGVETDVLAAWTSVFGDVAAQERPAVLAEMAAAEAVAAGWGAPSSTFPGLPDLLP